MSAYTMVESKRSKNAGKKNNKDSDSEDFEEALQVIENEDLKTFIRIKNAVASQLSDIDGVDAALLSTPELVSRAELLITSDNPTGQSPGMVANAPTMVNLLNRLETYSAILKKNGIRPSDLPKTVAKPKSSFPSFPPGRDAAKAHKAARSTALTVPAPAASPKVSKATVQTASGVKPLVMVRKSTKQYAVSTVQGQPKTRIAGTRSRYCPVDRLGSYTRGERKFATSAVDNERQVFVNPDQEVIHVNSDDIDVPMDDPPAKKQRIVNDHVQWVDLPLLPDAEFNGLDNISSDDIESSGDSEISVASIATSDGIHDFCDADLLELEQGFNAHLFYECVAALPHGVYVDSPPPVHVDGVFQQLFICPTEFSLPLLTDHDTTMSARDRRSCNSATLRHHYLFLCQRTLWHKTIDECRGYLLSLTKDAHMDVVMIGEGFTNSVWDHASTLQYDVQKLWYYMQMYGKERFDSILPDFSHVPLRHVTLGFLLTLPIKAVFGYMEYHGVDVVRTPWQLVSTLDEVGQLPVGTRVPFAIWHNYLIIFARLFAWAHEQRGRRLRSHASSLCIGSRANFDKGGCDRFRRSPFPSRRAFVKTTDRLPRFIAKGYKFCTQSEIQGGGLCTVLIEMGCVLVLCSQ